MESTNKRNQEPMAEQNLDGYGAPPIPWAKVQARLEQGFTQAPGTGGPDRHTCWLATTNPDGSPHVVPLGALWVDGVFYFTSGPATRKATNLAHDSRCVITVAAHDFDLVAEGRAAKVTDRATAQRIVDVYRAEGWEATMNEGEGDVSLTAPYSAPSAGPPPWYMYQVIPETVYAFGTAEPYGATRWRFA